MSTNPVAPNPEQRENKVLLFSMGVVMVAAIVLAIVGFFFLNKPDEIIEGQADVTYTHLTQPTI
ncbi:MAG: hypothetical protein K2L44_02590, partial [Duncaniella sp.]|nr:hypothetical protein [Duncaniella sp.]